ncbi:MAG: thioredoxin family protein [Candidatus Methanomethylicia archaeon]|nr:thioredoxin family protein [Candidatus Methanomethylicia archaeon]
MRIIPDEYLDEIKGIFGSLIKSVRILLFTQKYKCSGCREAEDLLLDLLSLSDKIIFEKYVYETSRDKFNEYNVTYVPTIIIVSPYTGGIARFLGVPLGYEFSSLLEDIVHASTGDFPFPKSLIRTVSEIDFNVDIKVFVTLTCPYCPIAVVNAHSFSLINPRIKSEMIDASLFPNLALKYSIAAVPKTIINDSIEIVGAFTPDLLLQRILEISKKR